MKCAGRPLCGSRAKRIDENYEIHVGGASSQLSRANLFDPRTNEREVHGQIPF